MWQKYKGKGVQVLALAIEEDNPPARLKEFRAKHKLTYPSGYDEKSKIIEKFGFAAIPANAILDKQGRLAAKPEDVEQITKKLDKMLK